MILIEGVVRILSAIVDAWDWITRKGKRDGTV